MIAIQRLRWFPLNKRILVACGLVAGSVLLHAVTPPTLTFQDRVKAQESIERVYYNHRIWPKENPQPKPSFEQMVPESVIEAKVADYLKKCAALDKYWQRTLQPKQLQAEMDRMARQTKDPAMLKELFAALGNDPTLVAECLARPVLADRLIRNWYAYDERFHAEARKGAEAALATQEPSNWEHLRVGDYLRLTFVLAESESPERFRWPEARTGETQLAEAEFQRMACDTPEVYEGGRLREQQEAFIVVRTIQKTPRKLAVEVLRFRKPDLDSWVRGTPKAENPVMPACSYRLPGFASREATCTEEWTLGALFGLPEARYFHTAVWTGTEMIVWGGTPGETQHLRDGGRYNPATDSWTATSTGEGAPSARQEHTVVWTGKEMIIWGGLCYGEAGVTNTGSRYDPMTDSWTPTSTAANVPTARAGHTAVWTGTEMIVWGPGDAGGRYNPVTDAWVSTSTGAGCPSPRHLHSAIWTGAEMIVWGGRDSEYDYPDLNTGGRYNPNTDSWIPTSTAAGCPLARTEHTAIWTGSEMIVWGGEIYSMGESNTGGRYNPSSDSWTATSTATHCPADRSQHTAVWTGSAMIVGGGFRLSDWTYLNSGGQYDPSSDSWTSTSTGANVPEGRTRHTAVWTGTEMILWGGSDGYALSTGGRYSPVQDSWVPVSTGANIPTARDGHTAIWTGAEMIVWGGGFSMWYSLVNTGGRYWPSTDSWAPTSIGLNVPSARARHSAIWTGAEMIVWGGGELYSSEADGGRYNPANDSWIPTLLGPGTPSPRNGHTAVWAGSEMIIWGGAGGENTGGRYSPSDDTWAPTSTGANVPAGRCLHTAVWTGAEMIVWGGIAPCNASTRSNSGGRYNPSTDSWVPTSTTGGVPSERDSHTAVWTGSEMIVWGGWNATLLKTGGRYNPSTDSWSPTSTGSGVPSWREEHTAVWTGQEMIVWGGDCCSEAGTGGRYAPSTDSWEPTSTGPNAPIPRSNHTAVWTGSRMIIWGGDLGGISALGTGAAYSRICCTSLVVSPAILPDTTVGASYAQTITASGGTTPYSFAITSGALPSGLTLSATGLLSGTPTQSGTFAFTVTATDTHSCTGSQDFSLRVSATPCPAIVLSPATLAAGTTGLVYSQTISASGGTAPYAFVVDSGALPTRLSLSSAGVLSGTPSAAGTFGFTVTAADANGCTGSQVYSLVITRGCPTITLSPASLPNGVMGTAYSQTLTASGGTEPYGYAVTSGALPDGLSLSASGVLSGTPVSIGTFSFTVAATDAEQCSGSQSYSLTIGAAPPVVSSMKKASSPFRIVVLGTNLQSGIQVSINGVPWTNVTLKNSGKLVIKGGASLKAAVPKGVDTIFVFANPDGGQVSVTWHW